jgi:hypothetical protein
MSLWAGNANPFDALRKGAGHVQAVQQLKDRTRERFGLGPDETIVVVEMAGTLPGFPPRETAVAFWTADGTRHHYKVFKPVSEVAAGDIPPAWLKASLALAEGAECECC